MIERLPTPPPHPFEKERIESLHELHIGDGANDPLMTAIGRRASVLCDAPIGLVTLIDETEQIVLACVGWSSSGTDRDSAFCAYAILQPDPMVVEDAANDPRFANNPSVLGEPHIRFYVGAPITDANGLPLGSVCVIDTKPRDVSSKQLLALQALARTASEVLEARRTLGVTDEFGGSASERKLAQERIQAAFELLNES